ncbi:unnamed protein product [Effrenium voratum]|nr:unnamed protein product [Effrenium voratum]|mmetsp:Transcript_78533/g.188382  ORF Transcript_78533/g.188382 Transcript_78533/m.188382 type:complete len:199 (-) Transcript_78533:48-644(-)|eukprot:CAMPEP_0181469730 /NCGR_PEP_ID=MMETSP1110-20121109/38174_1 /TAXON_ID=174948 /ORGANISM="Symbiodinium sp., Strain CCMP421" /LENGTH=198 /DNA_ID=CAMNT_0023594655 /DNA_START=67 /DNA_END=663 /DNA_ORIENTATION=+
MAPTGDVAEDARARGMGRLSMEISIPEPECDLQSYPPESVQVRNTFIHVASEGLTGGNASGLASCPARSIGQLRDLWKDEDSTSAGSKMVIRLEDSLFPTMPSTPEQVGILDCRQGLAQASPEDLKDVPLPPLEPAPGTLEMPSIGSRGHGAGDCKPCAFMHAKGCKNGALCAFCHLCDRTEKKRRQKAKKMMYNAGA